MGKNDNAQDKQVAQVERILVWYYLKSGYRITKFQSFRVKLWYFFESGKWMKQKIHTV